MTRISSLDRRNWADLAPMAIEILTPLLRTPHGTQTLRDEQAIGLLELSELGGLCAAGAVGSGKCCSWDTNIRDPRTGRLITAKQAVEARLPVVHSFTVEGFETKAVGGHWATGSSECLRIRVESGREIVVTPEHPMLTPEGWREAKDLQPGETLAAPSNLPEPSEVVELPSNEIDLLAVLFAEGSLTNGHAGFSTTDPEILRLVAQAVTDLGVSVRSRGGCDYAISGGQRGGRIPNPVVQLIKRERIATLAKEKQLPVSVFSLGTEQLARFFGLVWMCDGYVSRNHVPGITLASEKAVSQIQHLLLRFGIQSSVRFKQARIKDKLFKSWRLNVMSSSFDAFEKHLAPHMWGEKRKRLRAGTNPNKGLPRVSEKWLRAVVAKWPKGSRKLCAVAPNFNAQICRGQHITLSGRWKERAGNFSPELNWLTHPSIWWDRILSVKAVGVREVYDLTVPGTHNYVANDLVAHNTLTAGLSMAVLDEPEMLLVTAGGLVDSTRRHLEKLALHWRINVDAIVIKSYEWLSRRENADYFARPGIPRLVVFDEAHKLKALRPEGRRPSSVPVRFDRRKAADPTLRVVCLSGTFSEDGVVDYGHYFAWCLGQGSPVPLTGSVQKVWQQGLTTEAPERERTPLDLFAADLGLARDYVELRQLFRERVHQTPGVVISTRAYDSSRLELKPVQFELPEVLDEHFRALRSLKIAPDNWDLANAGLGGEAYDVARKLALGYYPKHVPWPPEEWYAARRAYGGWLRRFLEGTDSFETEGQVEELLRTGKLTCQEWDEWIEIAHTFTINREPCWESEFVLDRLVQWIAEQNLPNLCIWSSHREFARALSERLECPWFSNHGLDSRGQHIEEYRGRYAVSSIGANATGLNLQYHFCNALVVGNPSTNFVWEQMLGRHYRNGQPSEVVTFYYLATCIEHLSALKKAKRKAEAIEAADGMPCALNRAEIEWAKPGAGWAWDPE